MHVPSAKPSRFLGLIVLAAGLVRCGGGGGYGGSPTAPPPPTAGLVVEIHDNAFSPKTITIQPGDTVTWVLRGNLATHTVTESTGRFDSGRIFTTAGMTFTHTFTTADQGHTFLYYCQTHQGCCLMQGSVRVGNDAPDPGPGY
ncbi:MAG: plastocyanin/azurin family copper-binding protein [Thermoanaerobaculia bacterium]